MRYKYKELNKSHINHIMNIDASCYIKNAWREKDGKRQLVFIGYDEPGFPNGIKEHQEALLYTLEKEGFAIGVFDDKDNMIGFATLNRETFGMKNTYVLLDQMFISKNYRNQGIGKTFFNMTIDKAKSWNANRIYICAGSSEDTIAFYMRLGCVEAEELNQTLYDEDPRDFHLEYKLD